MSVVDGHFENIEKSANCMNQQYKNVNDVKNDWRRIWAYCDLIEHKWADLSKDTMNDMSYIPLNDAEWDGSW